MSNQFSLNSLIIVIYVSSSYKFRFKDSKSKVIFHILNLNLCQFLLDIVSSTGAASAAFFLILLNPFRLCQSVVPHCRS